jgi:carboxymethylenebutenolidase
MDPFGVNAQLRTVTRRLAETGYVAAAPDLYYRREERNIPYSNPDRAADLVMRTIALGEAPEERVKDECVFADIRAALSALEAHAKVDPDHLGALGFCMGARLAFLSACRLSDELRAAVCFYPLSMLPILHEARQLRAPLLLHFGGRDRDIPLTHVDRMQAELGYLGKTHEVKIYTGAEHGFFCEERPVHHAAAASDAWSLTLSWLDKYLR